MKSAPDRCLHVVLAYIERNGSVLITRRPAGVHLAGYWEFPGGKVQTDESFSTALRRELCEEIGVTIAVNGEIATTRFHYPDRTVELHLFRCAIVHGEPELLQVAEIRWIPVDELGEYTFPPANVALLDVISESTAKRGRPSCQKE
ncbi:MAG TPA: (deoxy)nucleoside triphosphate pyrophosphohydrolase [Armatimonadota bacterium]|nr:(deoxy)nucleoside triphosphate pyrophosphohydrolase [Armatimonadota bacterium]